MSRSNLLSQACSWSMTVVLLFTGCASPLFRAQSPEEDAVEQLMDEDSPTKFVGDLASAWGNDWLKIEGIGLVTQLNGTGSDPPPSPLLDQLKKEMQTHEVRGVNKTLASTETAMVMVGAVIPPGAQKGDVIDLRVSTPPRSRTKSLHGGWLMPARMRQLMVIDRSMHSSDVLAVSQGEVLVDAVINDTNDAIDEKRGRVIGGAVLGKPRQFGLGIHDEHSSVRTSSMIARAINTRFHRYNRGEKSGVANALRDNQVELTLHPRYKHNFTRFLRVIRYIAVGETPAEQTERLLRLEKMLQEPTTAELASFQLEAIGDDAAAIMASGLRSPDAEVRFYAAEALAYLDHPDATEPLYEAAVSIRAFRWRALTALASMEHYGARDALTRLMDAPSAETRYGAFRALRISDSTDAVVRGEVLGKSFGYHTISSIGEPMIHFSDARRPEVVLFGYGQKIAPPAFLYAGKEILIKGVDQEKLKVSVFKPGEETKQVFCSTSLDDLIRTIVDLGGGYQEVLVAMKSAHEKGYLDSRLEIGALPARVRRYHRDEEADASAPDYHVVNPVPELFSDRLGDTQPRRLSDPLLDDTREPPAERTQEGWFVRMSNWLLE